MPITEIAAIMAPLASLVAAAIGRYFARDTDISAPPQTDELQIIGNHALATIAEVTNELAEEGAAVAPAGRTEASEPPEPVAANVLTESAAAWREENDALTKSATNRRDAAAQYERIAFWMGVVAAALLTIGVIVALLRNSPLTGLTAATSIIPGSYGALLYARANRASADARDDEAKLRDQVQYQRSAAYALHAIKGIDDAAERNKALSQLAMRLAPPPVI